MSNTRSTAFARIIAAAVWAIVMFGGIASGQSETTTKVTVPGESGLKWMNTNVTVIAGDTVRLEATGEVDVGGSWGVHGPEGTTKFSEQPPGYYPLETKLRYGLAGKITLGSSRNFLTTQTWIYGEKKEIKVTKSGILWLTVNDDAPEGNVGEFAVTITVIRPAPRPKAKK